MLQWQRGRLQSPHMTMGTKLLIVCLVYLKVYYLWSNNLNIRFVHATLSCIILDVKSQSMNLITSWYYLILL